MDVFSCPHCSAKTTKRDCERSKITFFDRNIQQQVSKAKQTAVLINYTVKKGKKSIRLNKEPDEKSDDKKQSGGGMMKMIIL